MRCAKGSGRVESTWFLSAFPCCQLGQPSALGRTVSMLLSSTLQLMQRLAYLKAGCPALWRLWATLEEEELSWATR